MRYAMSPEEHARIFGPSDPMDATGTGRARRCKTCGGWHPVGRVPHNCRPPAPPRAPLSTPMIAPTFGEFMTGVTETAEYIGDRRAKREYMARNGLVEWDAGVTNEETWVDKIEAERDWNRDFKAVCEMDPLVRKGLLPERIGETDTGGAGEIDVTAAPIITGGETDG